MSLKKDLSIDFLGVKCENPFFLSSSPVGSNYEMCAKALEAGWGGIYYKTNSFKTKYDMNVATNIVINTTYAIISFFVFG